MRVQGILVGTLMTIAALAVTTTPASAASGNGVCESGYGSGELCLYYNSNLQGSMRDFFYEVRDFAGYRYLTPGAGQGQYVKNNAASAWNRDTLDTARIFYNRNFMGPADDVRPGTWRNLGDTKNDNASFTWL